MKRRTRKRQEGFTLVEIMIAVAIVGVLAAVAITNFDKMSAKSKRVEAKTGLNAVFAAQSIYYTNFGVFAPNYDLLGWPVEEADRVSVNKVNGDFYTFDIWQPWGTQSWWCAATGNIDPDPWPDVMVMYEQR